MTITRALASFTTTPIAVDNAFQALTGADQAGAERRQAVADSPPIRTTTVQDKLTKVCKTALEKIVFKLLKENLNVQPVAVI